MIVLSAAKEGEFKVMSTRIEAVFAQSIDLCHDREGLILSFRRDEYPESHGETPIQNIRRTHE